MVMMDTPPPWGFKFDLSLVVLIVHPGGQAERAGIKAGWRMLKLNGTSIMNFTHFKTLITKIKPEEESDEKYAPVRLTFEVSQVRVWGRV